MKTPFEMRSPAAGDIIEIGMIDYKSYIFFMFRPGERLYWEGFTNLLNTLVNGVVTCIRNARLTVRG
ncbi:MAG: hypothetical protein JXR67_03220 [Bacteroidales bacterium]|nr:hypothetical protein [Bacteroidales bacterium]MBN2665493.1 hypothetical protein [Bacteroidales bacterium]